MRTCTDGAAAVEGNARGCPMLEVLLNNFWQCDCFEWIYGGVLVSRGGSRAGLLCKNTLQDAVHRAALQTDVRTVTIVFFTVVKQCTCNVLCIGAL